MGSISLAEKPHAVCIPFPAQGHINPMLNVTKLFYFKGFHITFVNRFETIPDGLPPTNANVTQDIPSLCHSTTKTCLPHFSELLSKLNSSPDSPPLSCIVSDGIMSFTLDAAQELGIPEVLLWTTSACGFLAYVQFHHLIEKGLTPLKEPNDQMLDFILVETERAKRASAIIVNTFHDFEREVLDALSTLFRPVYSIGPLNLQIGQIPADNELNSIGSNLWTEEPECLEWLNSKEPTLWFMSTLAESRFWKRPDRSLLASWCPQEQVLNNPAIGGFFTHSGWNSTLESVCVGVPIICWPFFAEQQTNCRFSCKEWGIGLEIEGDVKRKYVEGLVRKLMDGEEGKEMRKKALEWKKLAKEASGGPNGLSFVDFDKMVNQLIAMNLYHF
ncbi:7-deoxyloganetin glucosyltransferase-like [Pyrus ussuriensis x Pyrus communis]|uniref:7-deoxyloganetin glucosyltransferase-like n=1 Tax=Pyrus ussuriensis x Pyrus communis TaxID=2448454 RepID=A0A5N5HRQ4_9ROSA|nr:7-deoxyloganetin glucosyltransferase-like [Pyrus ussuriensis x Pyrus communis]